MAFKGGTSLSKVYGAIRRFSEDVDVTVDYKSLDQSIDPFDAKTSRTAKEKFTELLRTKLADHTKNVIRPHFENLVAQLAEKPPKPKPITISDDGEKLFIPYPSRFGADESVFLEFGGRNVIAPPSLVCPSVAATAHDGHNTLAMLVRQKGETLVQLLTRLDLVQSAWGLKCRNVTVEPTTDSTFPLLSKTGRKIFDSEVSGCFKRLMYSAQMFSRHFLKRLVDEPPQKVYEPVVEPTQSEV
jgi:Nucleotidyl transferase AbiEii toxin, Type IV TA system